MLRAAQAHLAVDDCIQSMNSLGRDGIEHGSTTPAIELQILELTDDGGHGGRPCLSKQTFESGAQLDLRWQYL